MSYENIIVETHGKVGLIRLNMNSKEEIMLPEQTSFVVESCAAGIAAGESNGVIRLRNLDDGSERDASRPTSSGARPFNPVVSRDGSLIAFFDRTGAKDLVLRVVAARGGDAREIARVPDYADPLTRARNQISWSPDGRFVYFCRVDQNGMAETFRVAIAGGTPTSTGYKGPGAVDIDISPDGRHIISRWGHENQPAISAIENFLPPGK